MGPRHLFRTGFHRVPVSFIEPAKLPGTLVAGQTQSDYAPAAPSLAGFVLLIARLDATQNDAGRTRSSYFPGEFGTALRVAVVLYSRAGNHPINFDVT